ncbi:MAG: SigE family RNA polymerase sigma factor [Bifidobacteriaceae bacterium]|nr:SigE family RNA polymerase sigma factor [Bifidobacteriaceae bacterium]
MRDSEIPGGKPEEARAIPADFDGYVAEQWESLCRFAYLVTGNRDDAQDAVQDALAGLYPRWQRVRSRGNPGAYLRRSITNARISAWRKTRDTAPYHDIEALAGPTGDPTASVTDAMLVADLLGGLPSRQRAIVVLRYLEDLTYADIASVCGCTEAAARSVARYALESMRKMAPEAQK